MTCGQTHGLVTHRSIGDENGGVGVIGAAARQQFRAVPLDRGAVAAVGRGAVEARRDLADSARRRAEFDRQKEIAKTIRDKPAAE